MAKLNGVQITFEIEPLVKLRCSETDCQHNMVDLPGGWLCCELKYLEIGKNGVCDRVIWRAKKRDAADKD